MLKNKIPQKLIDPLSFIIPYSIGKQYNGKTLCDLGTCINLMPLSVFKQLEVKEVKPTIVTLQLADRSYATQKARLEMCW